MRAPGQGGTDVGGVDAHFGVERGAVVAAQRLPVGDGRVERLALRAAWRLRHPVERGLVRGHHAGARAGFDGHVAQGHALLHVQRLDGAAAELDDMAGTAIDADHADRVQHDVLGAHAGGERAIDGDGHRLRPALQQALRGQHMADFAGADAEGQRTERTVRAGVAVAADDGHARQGEALLRRDHMDDAAVGRRHVEQLDAVVGAVARQRVHLRLGRLRVVRQFAVGAGGQRGRGMVHRRLGAVRTARRQAARLQLGEGLRRGDLVDQVQVDVQHGGGGVGLGDHDVGVPQLVEQGAWCGHAGVPVMRRKKEKWVGRSEE